MNKLEKNREILLHQINGLTAQRLQTEHRIKEVLRYLGGPGAFKRIRTCAINDTEEVVCPNGNELINDL